jgi:hypothetical protein
MEMEMGMHGEIMAHMSGNQICIHNKHHSIYEMDKLQHKLKSEVRNHKIAKNTIWRMWWRGVCQNDGDGGRLTAGK